MVKKVNAIIKRDRQGNILEFHLAATESNDDWLRSARLRERADAGDEKARKELKKIDSNFMEEDEETS